MHRLVRISEWDYIGLSVKELTMTNVREAPNEAEVTEITADFLGITADFLG